MIAGSNPTGAGTAAIAAQAAARSSGGTHVASASIATVSCAGSQ
jgi:hypothetical protein